MGIGGGGGGGGGSVLNAFVEVTEQALSLGRRRLHERHERGSRGGNTRCLVTAVGRHGARREHGVCPRQRGGDDVSVHPALADSPEPRLRIPDALLGCSRVRSGVRAGPVRGGGVLAAAAVHRGHLSLGGSQRGGRLDVFNPGRLRVFFELVEGVGVVPRVYGL